MAIIFSNIVQDIIQDYTWMFLVNQRQLLSKYDEWI